MLNIRIAKLEDAPVLVDLSNQLGYILALETMEQKLQIYLNNAAKYNVFVAEMDNNVIGYIAISIDELFVVSYKKMQIQGIVVDEKYKGQGIGKALMQRAEEYARENECGAIDLLSGIRRAASGAHHFYKSIGYENQGPMAKLYLRKNM